MGEIFIKSLTCLFLCVLNVNSMSLQGRVLTRYDPCGLGVVHFDKISNGFWQGVVNLGLYTNLGSEVSIDIRFAEQVRIYEGPHNSTVNARDNGHNYVFKPKGNIPSRYIFFAKLGENDTDVPIVKKFSLNNFTMCDDAVKESEKVESLNVTKVKNLYQHVCGRRSLNHAEMTSVRTQADAGDWPWHVAIMVRHRDTNELKYQCGGNIVSRTAIVTAGHCVSKGGFIIEEHRIEIIAGVNNHSDVDQVGRQTFTAEKVILHPNYNDVDATSDVAIIKINKLAYTEYVQPICIWGPVYDKTNLFGYDATIVGFGRTEDNKPSQVLRSAYIKVQNDTTCIDYSPDLYKPLLNEFTFCAGYGPTSVINPRNGDSGGGLVVPTMQPDHKISWFLRGVLSKCGVGIGQKDCDPQFYVVYTDVGPHYGWIYHHSGLRFINNISK